MFETSTQANNRVMDEIFYQRIAVYRCCSLVELFRDDHMLNDRIESLQQAIARSRNGDEQLQAQLEIVETQLRALQQVINENYAR